MEAKYHFKFDPSKMPTPPAIRSSNEGDTWFDQRLNFVMSPRGVSGIVAFIALSTLLHHFYNEFLNSAADPKVVATMVSRLQQTRWATCGNLEAQAFSSGTSVDIWNAQLANDSPVSRRQVRQAGRFIDACADVARGGGAAAADAAAARAQRAAMNQ